MKSNLFKYIFIVFVIGIMIFAFFKMRSDEQENQQQSQVTDNTSERVKEI